MGSQGKNEPDRRIKKMHDPSTYMQVQNLKSMKFSCRY